MRPNILLIVMKAFHDEVRAKNFSYAHTNISMHPNEKEKFLEALDKES